MENKYLPTQLKQERDQKIKQAKRDAEKVNILNYVKFMLIPGVVLAVVAFLNVGSWYDDNYGFDGSAGAAFGAAIGVLIGFAILGAVLGGLVKMFKSKQADQIMQEYNEKAEEISHNATMMSSRFSNNERIQAIISKVTNKFSSAIQSANRPNYEKEISLSTKIIVSATEIQYADFERLNFKFERLAELTNVSERKSVAQVIAEGVAVRIKNQFTKDPSGTTPSVSVSYRNGTNEAIEAYVTYGCVNGNYKEITQW